jgi:NAD(P)-dependent dehydrogenase (short-subunit alcohol dehydrogenase family)
MAERKFAVVVGVGPGLGVALTRKFSSEGLTVVAAARDGKRLAELLRRELLPGVDAITCDVGDEAQVKRLFAPLPTGTGDRRPQCRRLRQLPDLSAEEVERTWRVGGLGAFHVGQAAARAMLPKGRGSIIFTGATAALRGGAGFAAFAMSKFAARALAQSMARELGPKGIHVAHVNIDGGIGEDRGATKLKPEAIADIYWSLHVQDRSAWSQEIDLRPLAERF